MQAIRPLQWDPHLKHTRPLQALSPTLWPSRWQTLLPVTSPVPLHILWTRLVGWPYHQPQLKLGESVLHLCYLVGITSCPFFLVKSQIGLALANHISRLIFTSHARGHLISIYLAIGQLLEFLHQALYSKNKLKTNNPLKRRKEDTHSHHPYFLYAQREWLTIFKWKRCRKRLRQNSKEICISMHFSLFEIFRLT